MPRWLAVGLGCVTALGIEALSAAALGQVGAGNAMVGLGYLGLFLALALGGYVTGHLVGRLPVLHAALAAVAYILVTATANSVREAVIARQFGLGALAPIDFVQLTVTDVLAMTGASCGGWLAGRW